MPIRTNRGRVAVYRRLWGWPMRSPKHLAATLAVVAVAVIAIGLIVPRLTGAEGGSPPAGTGAGTGSTSAETSTGTGDPGAGPGVAATETPPPPTSSLPTRLSGPTQTLTSAPPAPKALEVATLWAQAWVNHPEGVTAEQWLTGLQPYTTEEFYAAVMSKVDPRNVPATAVTGPATATASYTTSVTATVPTNAGALTLTVISTHAGWRVVDYDLAA